MLAFLLAGLLFATPVLAAFEVPANDGFVTDTKGILTPEQESLLEQNLTAYRAATSNEIAVLIVPSLSGEVIADAVVEVGRKWGIGTQENDNGILFFIAHDDQELFLGTGYGLEGAVPDIVAKGIVENDILPQFREGKYYEGIAAGIDSLQKHIGGEYTAERYAEPKSPVWVGPLFFVFFVLLQWGVAIMSRTKSWWLGGVIGAFFGIILTALLTWWLAIPVFAALGLGLDYIVSKNYKSRGKTKWWAGGSWGPGGSGGGSGGFGGFSGGSFGGGGAGGRW